MNSTTLRAERFTDAPPDEAKHGGRNTTVWCRGKVGVPHESVWQHWFECYRGMVDYQKQKCLVCGRLLDTRRVSANRPSHQLDTKVLKS